MMTSPHPTPYTPAIAQQHAPHHGLSSDSLFDPVSFVPSLSPSAADSASAKLLSDVGIGAVGLRPKGRAPQKSSQGGGSAQNISVCGLLSLEFYRPYFDVDTDEVKARLLQATLPMRQATPFLDQADEEGRGGSTAPDLYGPVWVSNLRCRPMFYFSFFRVVHDRVLPEGQGRSYCARSTCRNKANR